jgi:ribosome-binding factor A
MQSIRTERANSEVERALNNILRNKVNDPRLNEFITITYVELSVDFRHCKVGVSIYTGDKKVVMKQLRKSEGFIKRELVKEVRLPYTPELNFILDEGAVHSDKINSILSTLDIPEESEDDDETIN